MLTKHPFIIGTAGHIDHGKTSLIKALTGIDTDTLKEEKERGISIDLGFAYFDLPDGTRCGIVDVPGHERFIKNMLAGATGIDLVLFVVAADDGIMPQTKEHLEIMHLLRVQKGLFVITKIDLVAEKWINEIKKDLTALIEKTCLHKSPIVQFSAVTLSGLNEIKEKIIDIAKGISPKNEGGFFRLPIDRSFAIKGFGTVVTGTAASGRLKKGDEALLLPQNKKVKIRGLQSHKEEVEEISVSQRAAVNLSGVPHNEIKRGDFLVSTALTKGTIAADVEFEFLNSMEKSVKNYSTLKLHHLTGEVIARVRFAETDKAGAGDKIFGRIKLKTPLVMLRNDRFVLRDFSVNKTIGGGRVLLPFSLHYNSVFSPPIDAPQQRHSGTGLGGRLQPPAQSIQGQASAFKILEQDNPLDIMTLLLSGKDFSMDRHFIRMQLNLTNAGLSELILRFGIREFNSELAISERVDAVKKKVVDFLDEFHKTKSDEIGIEETCILKALGIRILPSTFKQILDELIKDSMLEKAQGSISLKGYKQGFEQSKNPFEQEIVNIFKTNELNPPKLDELRQRYNKTDLQKTFDVLLKKGILLKIAHDVYLLKETLEQARKKLAGFIEKNNKIKAGEFRDILNCSRKMAIEILEYFDKERFTLRSGDYRILRRYRS